MVLIDIKIFIRHNFQVYKRNQKIIQSNYQNIEFKINNQVIKIIFHLAKRGSKSTFSDKTT